MGNDRNDDSLSPDIEEGKDKAHGGVEQDMRKIHVSNGEDQGAEQCGSPKRETVVKHSENHFAEHNFLQDGTDNGDDDDDPWEEIDHVEKVLCILGSGIDSNRRFNQNGDSLSDESQEDAENSPSDGSPERHRGPFLNLGIGFALSQDKQNTCKSGKEAEEEPSANDEIFRINRIVVKSYGGHNRKERHCNQGGQLRRHINDQYVNVFFFHVHIKSLREI